MIGRSRSRRSRASLLALGLTVVIILIATLSPSYETASSEHPFCLLCGHRGVADAIDNVLLFAPLGVTLALVGLTVPRAVLAGAALSSLVELAQFAIVPGRDASPSDLLFNTVGAVVGHAALRVTLRWLYPEPPRWLSLVAAAGVVSAVALTGYLLRPSIPPGPYAGQWTESPGNLELYRGRILEATLGPVPIPPRPLEHAEEIRDLLRAGAPLDIRLIAGPPTRRLGQLFAIVENGVNREFLLLGIHGDDLVLRYRTRSNDLRLDAGALRVSNVLGEVEPGSAARLVVSGEADGYCVSVDATRTCGVAFSAANGWMVLFSVDSWPAWLRSLVSAGWLAALLLPVGFGLRRHWGSFLGLLVLSIGLTILPRAMGLSAPSAVESAGAVLGLLLGVTLSGIVRRRLRPSIRRAPAAATA